MFIWDGSRLVQEYNYKGTYTYIYTDQIGIPREQTDQFRNILWLGSMMLGEN